MKKNLFIIYIGALLEYYNFIIFGLSIPYLSDNYFVFFSNGLIISYLLFSSGYIFRAIGGTVFSIIADFKGRKKVFLAITFLSGLATFVIAILPASGHMYIALFLILLRFFQSSAFGAEVPNAVTILYEVSFFKQKISPISLVIFNSTIGALLAFLSFTFLTTFLTKEQMIQYGWRIPFFVGGGLTLILCFYRSSISTLGNVYFLNNRSNFIKLLTRNASNILLIICIVLPMAVLNIHNIFLPVFLHKFFHYKISHVYNATTLGLVWNLIILIWAGKIIYNVNPKKIIIFCLLLITATILYQSFIGKFSTISEIYFFIASYSIYNCFMIIVGLSVAVKIFPVAIRNTAVAISYNLTFFIASFTPSIIIKLAENYKNPFMFYYFFILGVVLFSGVSIYLLLKLEVKDDN